MTTITRNLPWFIRDLGVSIVSQECYTSLVENLDISDVKCIRYSLSKGLGIGVVVGGSVMKIPQLLLIVNARSARGISLTAYILETFSYAMTLAYSFRNKFPFSTYGENLFLTIQNIVITFLIIFYGPSSSKGTKILTGTLATIVAAAVLYTLPETTLSLLQLSTIPLSLFSKLPQIRQNARSKSTGQLSTFAVGAQIAGCAARLFTNATETGDNLVAAGSGLALLLNVVLGLQLWMYWGSGEKAFKEHGQFEVHAKADGSDIELKGKEPATASAVSPVPWSASPTHRTATPPPRTSSAGGSRKWARKVD